MGGKFILYKSVSSYTILELKKRYYGMKQRCYNHRCNVSTIHNSLGKGIAQEWLDSPDSFINWSMEHGFRPKLELGRLDHTKGYSPDNCHWITREENTLNRLNTNK